MNMKFTESMNSIVGNMRQTGQTTTCVGVLLQNKDAVMVVGNYAQRSIIIKDYPNLKNRILTVQSLEQNSLSGMNVVMVWDNTAIIEIINRAKSEGKAEGLEVKPKVSFETMHELMKVLKEMSTIYGVNIMVLPKPTDEKK